MDITPAVIKSIVEDVASEVGTEPENIFYADHNHEGLPEGAWSISLEGLLDQQYGIDWSEIARKHNVIIEHLYHWCLAVYPMPEEELVTPWSTNTLTNS